MRHLKHAEHNNNINEGNFYQKKKVLTKEIAGSLMFLSWG